MAHDYEDIVELLQQKQYEQQGLTPATARKMARADLEDALDPQPELDNE